MTDNKTISLTTPLAKDDIAGLRAGDAVKLNGVIYTGRDAAHRRMVEMLDRGESLPVDLDGQVLYFVGPTPAPPGRPIGSAGPTTSGRMDAWSPRIMERGLRGMIGKGARSQTVRDAMAKFGCVYFAAVGGAGALLSTHIKKSEVVAWPDLGTEAIHRFEVVDFPLVVINDIHGADLYEQGHNRWKLG